MKILPKRKAIHILIAAVLCCTIVFFVSACSEQEQTEDQAYIVSFEKTDSDGTEDIYTITYSDGTTSQFTVVNGIDGEDGADGDDLSISEIWEAYIAETGSELSLAEFIEQYLDLTTDYSAFVSKSLLSCVSIYAEFVETQSVGNGGFFPGGIGGVTSSQIVQSAGSGVIYKIGGDSVYIVTNYHVVYDSAADEDKNGGSKIGREIYCYLYGSETTPVLSGYDDEGYYQYDYGTYAIECEYIGGSQETDIAVLRADIDDVYAVNENVQAVTLAEDYHVGESVYAVGNAEGEGISATEGTVSVDNEYIGLDIDEDGTDKSYRSIRFDASIYHGNSGGGLFNAQGELIGITNAGIDGYENICYAIPVSIAEGAAENILYHYTDGDDATNGVYKITLGVTVSAENAKYALTETGYGKITEDIYVEAVTDDSIATQIGLEAGDRLIAVVIDGISYEPDRTFDLGDLILTMRPSDTLQFVYERNGTEYTTAVYELTAEMFVQAE